MKKNTTKPANITLARAAQLRARFTNPQAAVKARLAEIAARHSRKTQRFSLGGAQLLAERAAQDAAIEAQGEPLGDAPPEVHFDCEESDVPATLETIERAAREYEYRAQVEAAQIERAALLAHKAEISRRRLEALRAGAVKAAERLTDEFWATFSRLSALEEILIWEVLA